MSTLSVIIPHLEGLNGVEESLDLCVKSLKGNYDELIIVRNDGIGFGAAVNEGLAMATGDYLVVMNNDIRLIEGTLRALSMWSDFFVCVPNIIPPPRDNNPRCMFAMSRKIYEKVREEKYYFYDERFIMGYFEDDDLIKRLNILGIDISLQNMVTIQHLNGGGLTMKQIGEQKFFDINKKNYDNKWANI
jgi:GT2 family glycosyltransferase